MCPDNVMFSGLFGILGDIGYLTTDFAFREGMLCKPVDGGHDGEFLAMLYTIREQFQY